MASVQVICADSEILIACMTFSTGGLRFTTSDDTVNVIIYMIWLNRGVPLYAFFTTSELDVMMRNSTMWKRVGPWASWVLLRKTRNCRPFVRCPFKSDLQLFVLNDYLITFTHRLSDTDLNIDSNWCTDVDPNAIIWKLVQQVNLETKT